MTGKSAIEVMDFARLIRHVPDFPRPNILFRDIAPLLADQRGFAAAIEAMVAPWRELRPDAVIGIESRGFILAAAMAQSLGIGFIPIRKPGKLPGPILSADYQLEYGQDRLEIQCDAIASGASVLLVDDVLATGGTLMAALSLLNRMDASLCGIAVLIELSALGGRARLGNQSMSAALTY